ncbi:MAG: DUF2125 domain-containing protein [Beijerinckiaceae bacterium]
MQRRYFWLLAIVVLVCAGWTGAWFYGANFAGKAADQWMAREAERGRIWTCANRDIGGFPFRFALRCSAATFRTQGRTGPVDVTLGPVRAIVQVYSPKLVLAEADGPAIVKTAGNLRQIDANWENLRASVRLARPLSERISLQIGKLKAQVSLAGRGPEALAAETLEFHMRPAPDVTVDIGAIDVAITVSNAVSQLADNLSRVKGPANASVAARITRAPVLFLTPAPLPQRLEAWRQAQGTLTLQRSTISKGAVEVEASGALQIDEGHFLAGNINARAAGLGAILQQFGLPGGNIGGGLLGGLLGSRRGNGDDAPQRKVAVPLPLTLRDGAVWLGPIRTKARLQPLY